MIRFDSQATNQGGMDGLSPCSKVLDEATVSTLKGNSPDEPQCLWSDASTLEARLTMFTDAGPGMAVTVLPGVLWPRLWLYPVSCGPSPCGCSAIQVEDSMCAEELVTSVDRDFPCDQRDTTVTEICAIPQVLLHDQM